VGIERELTLTRVIERQFENAWDMLKEAIENFSPDQWKKAKNEYFIPARVAYHAIETVDYYCQDNLKGFEWGGRFGVDWETGERDRLPQQQEVLKYLDDIRKKSSDWIKNLGDQGLLSPDKVFFLEGMTHLDRVLYVLRHTHQHLGELCSESRNRNVPRPEWR
jgi:hypothetical protein